LRGSTLPTSATLSTDGRRLFLSDHGADRILCCECPPDYSSALGPSPRGWAWRVLATAGGGDAEQQERWIRTRAWAEHLQALPPGAIPAATAAALDLFLDGGQDVIIDDGQAGPASGPPSVLGPGAMLCVPAVEVCQALDDALAQVRGAVADCYGRKRVDGDGVVMGTRGEGVLGRMRTMPHWASALSCGGVVMGIFCIE
jgi:hypothetical protein